MERLPKSGPVTIYLDKALWAAFQEVCQRNPRIKSPSDQLRKLMRSMVETKGRRYGIKAPAHLS